MNHGTLPDRGARGCGRVGRRDRVQVAGRSVLFRVDPIFTGASYNRRYELLCQRLIYEQLYDAVCLTFRQFADKLQGHARGLVMGRTAIEEIDRLLGAIYYALGQDDLIGDRDEEVEGGLDRMDRCEPLEDEH